MCVLFLWKNVSRIVVHTWYLCNHGFLCLFQNVLLIHIRKWSKIKVSVIDKSYWRKVLTCLLSLRVRLDVCYVCCHSVTLHKNKTAHFMHTRITNYNFSWTQTHSQKTVHISMWVNFCHVDWLVREQNYGIVDTCYNWWIKFCFS